MRLLFGGQDGIVWIHSMWLGELVDDASPMISYELNGHLLLSDCMRLKMSFGMSSS